MRKCICTILVALCGTVHAQDRTGIVYSQEPDTLVRQRFIDKYENIFMTKVPTRHMLKLGVSQTSLTPGITAESIFYMNHELGYEYKISPSFSAGVNLTLYGGLQFSPNFIGSFSANLYGRWYFDMQRRIRDGKSANNFSGNFLSVVLERQLSYKPYKLPVFKAGAEFGIQRRFLNHGRMELAVGVYYQRSSTVTYNGTSYMDGQIWNSPKTVMGTEDILLATRSSLGMAFGDWRSSSNGSSCEILKCDQYVEQQWKVMWPNIALGAKFTQATVGAGYERKLNQGPLSINAQVVTDYNDSKQRIIVNQETYTRRSFQFSSSLQLRYYYLQKRKIRTGKGGNNLSGIYLGPHIEYIFTNSRYEQNAPGKNEHTGIGLTYGFQKTLLSNFYIDVNGAASIGIFDRSNINTSLRIGFGLRF